MSLLDEIKLRLGIHNKKLDAPLETLSEEQIGILLIELINDANRTGIISKKIYDIVDLFSDYKSIRYYIENSLKENLKMQYKKELDLNHTSEEDSKELLFRYANSFGIKYLEELFEKVFQNMNISEICAFIKKSRTNIDLNKVIGILAEKNIELPEYFIEEIIEFNYKIESNKMFNYILKLPYDKQFKIISSRFKYDSELMEHLNKHIEGMEKIDSIFYCIAKKGKNSIDFEDINSVSVNELFELLTKYKTLVLEFAKMKLNDYSIDELGKLKDIIVNANFKDDKELKELFEILRSNIDEKIKIIQINEEVEAFCNIKNEEEKEKAFLNINSEIILKNPYFFKDYLKKMTKEDFIKRFGNVKFNLNLLYYVKDSFSSEELFEYVKSQKGKYNNNTLSEVINLLNVKEIERIGELIDYNNANHKNTMHLWLTLNSYYKENVSSSDELFEIILKLTNSLLKNNDKDYNYNLFLSSKLDTEKLKIICNKYPNILNKIVNFNVYKASELLPIKEMNKNNIEFNNAILEKILLESFDYSESIGKITEEAVVNIIKECKNSGIDINSLNNIFFKKMDRSSSFEESVKNEIMENVLDKLDDEEIILFLSNKDMKYYLEELSKYDSKRFKDILQKIDNSGVLLKLYNNLKSQNIRKYNKKNYTDVSEIILNYNFIKNIDSILNNKDVLLKMLEKNPDLLITLNYSLLKIMDGPMLEYFSKYQEMGKIHLNEDEEWLKITKKMISRVSDRITYSEPLVKDILDSMEGISPEKSKIFLEKMDLDELIYLAIKHPRIFESNDSNIIINYRKSEIEHSNKIITNSNSTLRNVQDAYMRRFFGMNLEETEELIRKFESGIDLLIKDYESKEELTYEEKSEYESLKKIKYLKEILNIKDKELLKSKYKELSSNPEYTNVNLLENVMIEEKLKAAYTREKIGNLYVPKEEDFIKTKKYGDKEVKIYGTKEFNMFITVVGAYVKNSKNDKAPKETWLRNGKSHEICISLISNQNMSMAINRNNLKYGFYSLKPESIQEESEHDMASFNNQIKVFSSWKFTFRTTKDMINRIRKGHSEHLLERRLEDGSNEKRLPDYIIAMDKVTKKDLKAASEFGIPIILLDTKEIAKNESFKIEEIMKKLDKNVSEDLLAELVSRYHNNYSGLLFTNRKALRKYFAPKKMESYFESLVDKIDKIQNTEERSGLAKKYIELLEEEEKNRSSVKKIYIPFDFTNIKNKLNRIIENSKLKENSWKVNVDEKTPMRNKEQNGNYKEPKDKEEVELGDI